MPVTAREIIECIKAMTVEERQELDKLIAPQFNIPHIPGAQNMSGLELQSAVWRSLTEEQREEMRRGCYTSE